MQHFNHQPHKTAAVSARILCTPHSHAPVYSVTSVGVLYCLRRVHVCLAVTCHLPFWQNDWDLYVHRGDTDTEIKVGTEI